MADHEEPSARGLFGGVFARGGVEAGDTAWLQAMLDAEAGLARALERAGLAPAGSGEAITATAKADNFDPNELGELAALTGNPVPGLARALARQVPQTAVSAVHRGATSQDIIVNFSIGVTGYLAILGQIGLMAMVTALASRRTVNRTLETID